MAEPSRRLKSESQEQKVDAGGDFVAFYMQSTSMKTFTFDEAQSLLPELESLLKSAIEGKQAAEQVGAGLVDLATRIQSSGGMRVDTGGVARQHAEMEALLKRARDNIAEIDAIGVQVKDLESGLLDFPFRLDGQVVLLCWRMGEPVIGHWHTLDAGFQGRQPIDERFHRGMASDDSGSRPS
jgi:hypothetical protein